jgi:hypothetical protein
VKETRACAESKYFVDEDVIFTRDSRINCREVTRLELSMGMNQRRREETLKMTQRLAQSHQPILAATLRPLDDCDSVGDMVKT